MEVRDQKPNKQKVATTGLNNETEWHQQMPSGSNRPRPGTSSRGREMLVLAVSLSAC